MLESSGVATEDGQFDPRQAAEVLGQVRGGFDTDIVEEMASNCIERRKSPLLTFVKETQLSKDVATTNKPLQWLSIRIPFYLG